MLVFKIFDSVTLYRNLVTIKTFVRETTGLIKISGVMFSGASFPDLICFSWRRLAIYTLIIIR